MIKPFLAGLGLAMVLGVAACDNYEQLGEAIVKAEAELQDLEKKFFIQNMFLNLIGMVFIWEERFHQILIGMS